MTIGSPAQSQVNYSAAVQHDTGVFVTADIHFQDNSGHTEADMDATIQDFVDALVASGNFTVSEGNATKNELFTSTVTPTP